MTHSLLKSPLDHSLLSLDDSQLAFFRKQTGIYDTEELKQYILDIQEKAYQRYPYPCIRRFLFTKLQITRFPNYKYVLDMGKTFENPIFLDVGCCFGHDLRALVADGYPHQWVLGTDLRRGLWNMGLKLFQAAEKEQPINFIEGNILDDEFLDLSPPYLLNTSNGPPSLENLQSLTPLKAQVCGIHTSMLFHLFSENDQLRLAKKLASLLSPVPGSIIFGNHIALAEAGIHPRNTSGIRMFCHSPQTWREMWEQVFPKDVVQIDTDLVATNTMQPSRSAKENTDEYYGNDTDERWDNMFWLVWSVKRL